VPDGSRDIQVEKGLLLEYGIDRLNGISWDKGCYVGQELTARTRHRANIRKRLVAVRGEGGVPAPGAPVMLDDRTVGEVRSGQGDLALVFIRLDALEAGRALVADGLTLVPLEPNRH
jgi:folate-binding protein YgfZ